MEDVVFKGSLEIGRGTEIGWWVPGRWQPPPSGGDGSCSSSGWLGTAGASSNTTRNDPAGTGTHPSQGGGVHGGSKQDFTSLSSGSSTVSRHQHHPDGQQHLQQQQQQQQQQQNNTSLSALNSLNSLNALNSEQLSAMHQKLQNNLQTLQQQVNAGSSSSLVKSTTEQLNMMLQSCSSQKQHKHHQLDTGISSLLNQIRDPYHQSGGDCGIGGKPKCPECGKIYSNNSNLKQHIVNVHTVQTQYISCHVCNKQFKTKQYLQIHLLSMHGIRKRKSYPVYQSSHTLAQQLQHAANTGQIHQQYASPESWTDEKN